ncbi:MAG: 5'-phosphoribosylglycinamide transformylase [Pseudomonadales bacterium]|nr:5'-phosphoribosylglycinamide transformylase [Pseudomonadales bacterium]
MRKITVDPRRLLQHSAFFMLLSTLITLLALIWFSGSWDSFFTIKAHTTGLKLTLAMLIYTCFPLLILRFMYYFMVLLKHGRKADVAVFCIDNLFNPFNFLFFPSLLNITGITARRRCLITVILLLLLYAGIYLFFV